MFGRFHLLFATATFATTVLSHSRQVVAFGVDPMSSPTTRYNANNAKDAPVILLIGSCGLDRLLAVSSYPVADAKIRTNSYTEVGGGNAANTASGTSIYCCYDPIGVDKVFAMSHIIPKQSQCSYNRFL